MIGGPLLLSEKYEFEDEQVQCISKRIFFSSQLFHSPRQAFHSFERPASWILPQSSSQIVFSKWHPCGGEPWLTPPKQTNVGVGAKKRPKPLLHTKIVFATQIHKTPSVGFSYSKHSSSSAARQPIQNALNFEPTQRCAGGPKAIYASVREHDLT